MKKVLVHDKTPVIEKNTGNTDANFGVATSTEEYEQLLLEKMQATFDEYVESRDALELVKFLEVIEALCALNSLTFCNLFQMKALRNTELGGFSKRIILYK